MVVTPSAGRLHLRNSVGNQENINQLSDVVCLVWFCFLFLLFSFFQWDLAFLSNNCALSLSNLFYSFMNSPQPDLDWKYISWQSRRLHPPPSLPAAWWDASVSILQEGTKVDLRNVPHTSLLCGPHQMGSVAAFLKPAHSCRLLRWQWSWRNEIFMLPKKWMDTPGWRVCRFIQLRPGLIKLLAVRQVMLISFASARPWVCLSFTHTNSEKDLFESPLSQRLWSPSRQVCGDAEEVPLL